MTNSDRDVLSRFSSNPRKREIAYHEASRAVISMRLGGDVTGIELCDAGNDDLERWALIHGNGLGTCKYLEKATSCLVGPLVECLVSGGDESDPDLGAFDRISCYLIEHQGTAGVTEDLQEAWMALSIVCAFDLQDDRQLSERLAAWQWLTTRTYRFALEHWGEISEVAEELLAQGVVSDERLKAVVHW